MAGQVVGLAESEPRGFDFVADLAIYAEQGVGGVGITTGGPKPTRDITIRLWKRIETGNWTDGLDWGENTERERTPTEKAPLETPSKKRKRKKREIPLTLTTMLHIRHTYAHRIRDVAVVFRRRVYQTDGFFVDAIAQFAGQVEKLGHHFSSFLSCLQKKKI